MCALHCKVLLSSCFYFPGFGFSLSKILPIEKLQRQHIAGKLLFHPRVHLTWRFKKPVSTDCWTVKIAVTLRHTKGGGGIFILFSKQSSGGISCKSNLLTAHPI